MSRYATGIPALVAALLLLAACNLSANDGSEAASPKYLVEEIPACEPVEDSTVDPCEPDVSWMFGGDFSLGSEPLGIRYFFELLTDAPVYLTFIVLRGTYLPDTVRCTATGDRFRPPPYHTEGWYAVLQTSSIKCYADVRVNNYVLGSGPSNLTVLVLNRNFGLDYPEHVLEEVRRDLERVVLEGGEINSVVSVPDGGIEGREMILFVGPTIDASAEAWEVFITWSVERQNGGTVVAVHPFRGVWRAYSDNYETYRSQLEIELPAFTQAVTTANQERITEYAGRIGADEHLPLLVTDANQLSQFYRDTGAYNHSDGPPVQPPPPCGLVVSNQLDNPGLMLDCFALLAAKDTLRGTATLNWGLDKSIANWNGVTVEGTPKRVTRLVLTNKSLTGSIPPELGQLSGLDEIRLAGNSLTGCIPTALEDVATNDLASLNLPYCEPSPSQG